MGTGQNSSQRAQHTRRFKRTSYNFVGCVCVFAQSWVPKFGVSIHHTCRTRSSPQLPCLRNYACIPLRDCLAENHEYCPRPGRCCQVYYESAFTLVYSYCLWFSLYSAPASRQNSDALHSGMIPATGLTVWVPQLNPSPGAAVYIHTARAHQLRY